ncbi:hypothetical protein V6N13_001613 [Hibiscus sabdariffa]
MGDNANQSLDGEKVTFLISTNQRSHLDGVLELEAGRECYIVRVKEPGFNIHLAAKQQEEIKIPILEKEESSSDSSSEKGRRSSSENYKNPMNIVSINAISLGIIKNCEMDVPR